jgi:hypothetical protein
VSQKQTPETKFIPFHLLQKQTPLKQGKLQIWPVAYGKLDSAHASTKVSSQHRLVTPARSSALATLSNHGNARPVP